VKIDAVLLCDAATVREGLLHILGGGITRIGRPSFPTGLGVSLAIKLSLDDSGDLGDHSVTVDVVQEERGERVGGAKIDMGLSEDQPRPTGEPLSAALVLPFAGQVVVPKPGRYRFDVAVDGGEAYHVPVLTTLVAPEPAVRDSGD
jgi:uncharacterized protein DUF6941